MNVKRLKLHLDRHTCEMGVPVNSEEGITPCGEAAFYKVDWGGDPLYLCGECFDELKAKEEPTDDNSGTAQKGQDNG